MKDYEYFYIRVDIREDDLPDNSYKDSGSGVLMASEGDQSCHWCRLVAPNDKTAYKIGRTLLDKADSDVVYSKELVLKI